MLEKVTRMIKSVIFTALVLAFHVEVFKDDNVFNQSDMCYLDNKIEKGTRETENICHMKMGELSRNLNKRTEQFEIERHKNVKTSRHCMKEKFTDIATGIGNYSDPAKNESIKQNERVQEYSLEDIFRKEIEKVRNDMMNYSNQSKHEYIGCIQQLQSHMGEKFNTSQHLFLKEMTQAQNKLISFINRSKIESNEHIKEITTDIRGDIANMTKIIDDFRNLSDRFRNEYNGLIKELKREIQENVTVLQKYIANEVRNSRSNINYEIKNYISDYGSMTLTVCAIQVIITSFCCWKRSSKSTNQQQKLESETPELNMENSVAVVSFTEENRELHLTIARTVASAFRIHPTYVGGLNNILNIELNSKVCLIFVDKNERNIILETDVDISTTRSNFVEGQVKRGSTHVLIVYCQHEGSRNLTTLYNRNLGNIKQHATLKQLQRQNRVLTIDKEFSPYQTDYLRIFLNEMLID
ncbi:uncharacterized protein LOC128175658 [Crassostrea angulata]|uniref:uncharacterized protein LOC128175658 n=1 Tax=Magallana angulata TaxID=2784310 RepID=UPI0022B21256|nr:uncharacterized protein LOC128175658 [Crassostrea angulata]